LSFLIKKFSRKKTPDTSIDYKKIEKSIDVAMSKNFDALIVVVQDAFGKIEEAFNALPEALIQGALGGGNPEMVGSEPAISQTQQQIAAQRSVESRMTKKLIGMFDAKEEELALIQNPLGKIGQDIAFSLIPGVQDIVEKYPFLEPVLAAQVDRLTSKFMPTLSRMAPGIMAQLTSPQQQNPVRSRPQAKPTGFSSGGINEEVWQKEKAYEAQQKKREEVTL